MRARKNGAREGDTRGGEGAPAREVHEKALGSSGCKKKPGARANGVESLSLLFPILVAVSSLISKRSPTKS